MESYSGKLATPFYLKGEQNYVTKTYKDFNGVERTETKLFNLTETEVMEMELGTAGGVAEMLQRIVDAKDQPTIIKFFKEFILKAYGEKSADGTYFEKSEEISRKFAVSAKLGGVAAISSTIFCLWNLLQMTAKPLNS